MLNKISKETITAKTKLLMGPLNKQATGMVKSAAGRDLQKSVVLAYINSMFENVDAQYKAFKLNISAHSTDAELVVIADGMDPANHSTNDYMAALKVKLDSFRKSGVPKIGRHKDWYDGHFEDRRVVWLKHADGSKSLWFQKNVSSPHAGGRGYRRGDPTVAEMYPKHQYKFGEMDNAKDKLDKQVPEEFWEEAVAVSTAKWGAVPTLDDPFSAAVNIMNDSAARGRDYAQRMQAAKVKHDSVTPTVVRTDVPSQGSGHNK